MEKVVFLGDSITAGENNAGISFVDYYAEFSPDSAITKIACSGTTFGEYSIYPVERHSLSYVIQDRAQDIAGADKIFIEYGLNDVAAIVVGNVSLMQAILAFARCLDAIKQLAPHAEIYFLSLGSSRIAMPHFQAICNYLFGADGYLKSYISYFQVSDDIVAIRYDALVRAIAKQLPVISMFDSSKNIVNTFSSDGLHPNDIGHRLIAKNILKYFSKESDS